MGRVEKIYVTAESGKPLTAVDEVAAEAGVGLAGDRYATRDGRFSKRHDPGREITLIEKEAIDELLEMGLEPPAGNESLRRNVVVSGISLDALVGKEFTIGGDDGARIRGVRLCPPCSYLSGIVGPLVMKGRIGKSAIYAAIVASGTIRPGDEIHVVEAAGKPDAS